MGKEPSSGGVLLTLSYLIDYLSRPIAAILPKVRFRALPCPYGGMAVAGGTLEKRFNEEVASGLQVKSYFKKALHAMHVWAF